MAKGRRHLPSRRARASVFQNHSAIGGPSNLPQEVLVNRRACYHVSETPIKSLVPIRRTDYTRGANQTQVALRQNQNGRRIAGKGSGLQKWHWTTTGPEGRNLDGEETTMIEQEIVAVEDKIGFIQVTAEEGLVMVRDIEARITVTSVRISLLVYMDY